MAGDKEKVQTSTNTPFGSQYISSAMGDVQKFYETGRPYWAQAPVNTVTHDAFNMTAANARGNVPGLPQAQNYATGMIANNGMTGDMNQVAGDIRNGMRQTWAELTPFSNGSMQEDPRLQQMLNTNADRAANAAATRFGGGRYGSAAIGQGVGSAVADATNPTMLQSNENARSRQLQAASTLGSLNVAGNGLLGNIYEGGLNRATQATSMLPALNELRYDGATRLAGIGDYFQQRDQAQHDYQGDLLKERVGLMTALGGMGGTTIQKAPGPSAAQSILGGAATGGALLGPWGAIGGGLLGAFG